jgi:hypothetical protein
MLIDNWILLCHLLFIGTGAALEKGLAIPLNNLIQEVGTLGAELHLAYHLL